MNRVAATFAIACTTLFAASNATVAHAQQRFPETRERLTAQGFEVSYPGRKLE